MRVRDDGGVVVVVTGVVACGGRLVRVRIRQDRAAWIRGRGRATATGRATGRGRARDRD